MPLISYEAVRHLQQHEATATSLRDRYHHLATWCQRLSADTFEEIKVACEQLAAAYLPDLSDESLARIERLTGFLGFERRDPRKAIVHERHVIETNIARIRADERYQNRELLAGPHGTLRQKLAEAEEMLAPFQADCDRFETQLGFLELVNNGYDTPDYQVRWWQAGYWQNWATGDRICAALGMKDFGDDVLPAYRKAAEPRDFWRNERNSIQASIDEVHSLVQQHDHAVARLRDLPAAYLAQAQQLLAEHLQHADTALLDEWLAVDPVPDRAIRMALRRVAGLTAKRAILQELHGEGLPALVANIEQRRQKYARKALKLSRPKHSGSWVDDRQLDLAFTDKAQRMAASQGKLERQIQRLIAADNYADFDLANDSNLWWYHFTGTRPPRMAPQLRAWYDRHPDIYVITDHHDYHDHDDHAAEAIAMAAASRELDDVGYLS